MKERATMNCPNCNSHMTGPVRTLWWKNYTCPNLCVELLAGTRCHLEIGEMTLLNKIRTFFRFPLFYLRSI